MDLTQQIIAFFKDGAPTSSAFLSGLPELQEVSELGKGLANINYLLNFGSSRFVMRFNVWPDQVWYNGKEIDIENEYQVLRFLESYKVAPRAYFFDTSKSFFPFSFLIEEYLEHENKAVDTDFEGIAKTIKTLHSVNIRGGVGFLRKDSDVEEKIKLYEEWLAIISKDNEKGIASLFSKYVDVYRRYLRDNAELLTGETLIHRDLFPENILFREDGWLLIDWQTAVIGNPIQDIAYLLWDFIYQYTLKRSLSEEEKKTIITAYYGETADVQGILSDVDKLLPIFYVDLFIWLLYKAESLKEQELPAELKEFLSERIAGANDIILKEDQIEFWFSKMKGV